MPRKHYCYIRSILYGIGEGVGWGGVKVVTRTASAVKNTQDYPFNKTKQNRMYSRTNKKL